MKRVSVLLLFSLLVVGSTFAARPQKVVGPGLGASNFRVPFHQTSNVTFYKDTTYILTGWYFVDSLYRLTIQPGTLILGDSASGGSLIIKRGAKINAGGTLAAPIVFTSAKGPGNRYPGDWGGVVILGNAPTNKPSTQQIEGGFGTIPNTDAMYGGSDPNDSSGVFQYVRIEFGGIAFAVDNEINGLTFGGVGSKTVVDHVQVSFSGDDDYEFFGGTVQAKYLASWRSVDDCFDTDFGFAGKLQFCFVKRDPNLFDASASGSSNGFESDNEATAPYAATPRTSVKVSNMTLIGPAMDSTAANALNSKWGNTSMLRRATELSIYNSVLTGWRLGINIRDSLTQRAALEGRLEIRNTSIAVPTTQVLASTSPTTPNAAGFDPLSWFNTVAYHNNGGTTLRQASDILPTTSFNLTGTFDPVPSSSGEIATAGTDYASGRLAGDTWFTSVSYRGAFDPSKPMSQQWTAGWTNFDPKNTDYSSGVTAVEEAGTVVPATFGLEQNFPNPFNPSTVINYQVSAPSAISLTVYDVLGREVATLVNEQKGAGRHSVTFDGSHLSSGVYFYQLHADGSAVAAKKMALTK